MKSVLLIFPILLLSCNRQDEHKIEAKTNFDMEQVKAHIREMNKSYGKRFTTGDSSFYADRYCNDAEVFPPGLPAVTGRDSIRNFFYSGGNNSEAIIELPAGNFYGNKELIIEEGTYNFPDGKGGSIDKGKFIAIWKQEEGKWKLYREIWNTDLATAGK